MLMCLCVYLCLYNPVFHFTSKYFVHLVSFYICRQNTFFVCSNLWCCLRSALTRLYLRRQTEALQKKQNHHPHVKKKHQKVINLFLSVISSFAKMEMHILLVQIYMQRYNILVLKEEVPTIN